MIISNMNIKFKLDYKRCVGSVLIAGLLMLSSNAKAQIINACDYKHQADVNVY